MIKWLHLPGMRSSAFYVLDIPVYTCSHADFLQDTTTLPDNCTAKATRCVKGQQKGLSGEVALAYQNAKYWGERSKTQLLYVTKLETFKVEYIILMFQYPEKNVTAWLHPHDGDWKKNEK